MGGGVPGCNSWAVQRTCTEHEGHTASRHHHAPHSDNTLHSLSAAKAKQDIAATAAQQQTQQPWRHPPGLADALCAPRFLGGGLVSETGGACTALLLGPTAARCPPAQPHPTLTFFSAHRERAVRNCACRGGVDGALGVVRRTARSGARVTQLLGGGHTLRADRSRGGRLIRCWRQRERERPMRGKEWPTRCSQHGRHGSRHRAPHAPRPGCSWSPPPRPRRAHTMPCPVPCRAPASPRPCAGRAPPAQR